MRLLLDTHALIWWLAGNERLTPRARDAIVAPGVVIFASAASAWEITTKHRLGKLPIAAGFAKKLSAAVASQEFRELPITFAHAEFAGSLAGKHGDPFDRMLIAQSLNEELTLVSNERLFDSFGVSRLW